MNVIRNSLHFISDVECYRNWWRDKLDVKLALAILFHEISKRHIHIYIICITLLDE